MDFVKRKVRNLSEKLKNVPWIKIAPYGGAVLGVIFFLVLAITTYNDAVNKREEQGGLVTRFPMDSTQFFNETEPDSGIVLSWYDNTVKIKSGTVTNLKLNAHIYPITLGEREFIFESSSPECAEIDGEGNITAKKTGSVEFTVSNKATGLFAKAYLQIIQPVEGLYIQNSSLNVYTTDTGVRIIPIIYPENASNTAVRWYSKDTNIAEVDQTGHIKPKSTGMTEVVATTADGDYTAKCFVNVINETIKVEQVNILNKDKTELNRGESLRLFVSVAPQNARNKHISWQSSDPSIITVTKNGQVKAKNAGTATVYAISSDGVSDSFDITVKPSQSSSVPSGNSGYTVGGVTYVAYDMTLDEMAQKQMQTNPVYNDGSGLKSADKSRTKQYLDPNEFSQGGYKYQFMDLSHYNGISRDRLAKFLEGKGILSGKADTFIAAARQYNVSELYLVAHACLETGYGTSQLATGVNYNGIRVYNMFGIGAYDSDAVETGSKKAYSESWTTPEKAIMGGAEWISRNYINASKVRQNTLYKMRWNPDNPATHLYAGDIAWAVTQSLIMEQLFNQFTDASISYEIPVYEGSVAPVIDGQGGIFLGR